MSKWRHLRNLARFVLLLSFAKASPADETPTKVTAQNRSGDLPFSTSIGSDIERVDIGSGNLVVTIPIAAVPGRAMNFNFVLRYDGRFLVVSDFVNPTTGQESQSWNVSGIRGLPSPDTNNVMVGWGSNISSITYGTQVVTCSTGPPAITATYNLAFMYQDPNGTKHPLGFKYSPDGPGSPICGQVYDFNEPDLAGEGGWTINKTSGTGLDPLVLASDGTRYDFYGGSTRTDANGNQLTGEGPGATDTLGRIIVTQQTISPNQILYKLYDSSGTLQTYTVNFTNISLSTAFHITGTCCGLISEYSGTRKVVSSIVLPNGRSYQFQYESNSYGGLTQISLPEGATINYTWATLSDSVRPDRSYRYVASRQVIVNGQQSTWTFARTGNSIVGGGDSFTTTVTDPLGNQSVYVTVSGATTSAKIYAGTATGNPIRQYQVGYWNDGDPDSNLHPADKFPVAQRPISINTTLDNGLVSRKEFDYDSTTYTNHPNVTGTSADYNTSTWTISRQNVTEIREYDWGSNGSPGPLLRRTRKAYLHVSNAAYVPYNIVDRVSREVVCQPQATCDFNNPTDEDARTDYLFDGSTITSTSSNAPQHDYTNYSSSFTTRGNATAVQRWRSASDSAPLTTSYVYDDLGNIRSITDPGQHTTSWSYTDSWANSSCPPPTGKNSQAYVTQVTNALNQLVQFTLYPCTGLLRARKDQNDINAGRAGTTSTYDLLARLTQKNFPDLGQTSISYNDVPPVSITTTTKVTSSQNLVSVSVKDGLGREIQSQQTSNPLCTVLVDTTYDLLGRKASTSNPYCTQSDATYGVTSFAYDVVNRPTTVTQPGGATVLTSYTGRATSVSDEGNGTQRVQRISQTDGLGRLTSLCEVSSTSLTVGQGNVPAACGQDTTATGFLTTYQYNLLGNLTQVTQSGLNPRTFGYDALSRLTQSTNPESGTINYSYDADSACPTPNSFPGLLVKKVDARSVRTCMQYDQVNRLTQKNYSDSTPTANLVYDASSVSGLANTLTNPVGRLVQVSTSNTNTVNSYDPMGRVTNQWQCTPRNCGTGWFPFAYLYDYMGNPTSASNGVGVTFTSAYNAAAQLTSMTSSLSNANHPGTLLSQAVYSPLRSLTSFLMGTGSTGVTEAMTYNNRGWLQAMTAGTGYTAATSGTGSVTVSGSEQFIVLDPCQPFSSCPYNFYDSGTVSITVNGFTASTNYDQTSTAASLASSLAAQFNGSSSSPVTASASNAVVSLTAKATGASTNYSLSTSSSSDSPSYFGAGSFTLTRSGPTLTGGSGSSFQTVAHSFNLSFALNGDVLSASHSWNGNLLPAENWTYSYDPFNRLLGSNKNSGAEVYSYDYDRFGNRWHQNGPDSSQLGFDANNRITAVTGVAYDLAGNLTSDGSGTGTHSYFYDAENRIIQVDGTLGTCSTATACYVYDANGQRIRKTTGSTSVDYLYDLAGHEIVEVASSGTWNRAEIYAGGRHVATYSGGASGTTYFTHSDWLGTERARTNVSGALYEACTNLPFGDWLTCSATDVSPMHFTGKERDSESGLDNFGARYNSSSIGRFMSPDPLYIELHRLVDPQRLNLYAYARNDPVTLTDPNGLDVTLKCDTKGNCQKAVEDFNKRKGHKFEVELGKDGKLHVVKGSIAKGIGGAEAKLLGAINDTKNHATINVIGNTNLAEFGVHNGMGVNTVDMQNLSKLDAASNGGGLNSGDALAHEAMDAYYSLSMGALDADLEAAELFPGLEPTVSGEPDLRSGTLFGETDLQPISNGSGSESITRQYVTPIPDFLNKTPQEMQAARAKTGARITGVTFVPPPKE